MLLLAHPVLAQTFDFNLPKGAAAARLAAWSKVTGIRIQLSPAAPAELFRGKTTHAVKGRMDAYEALNRMVAGTPLLIVAEDPGLVTFGALRPLPLGLDSDPRPGASDPADLARDQALRAALAPAFSSQVIARLLVRSSFQGTSAVGLELDKGRYSVLVVEPRPRSSAAGASQMGPKVCEAAIAPALGGRLARDWREVVARKVPAQFPGVDGVTYDFAFRQGADERRRELWEPSPSSAEGQIVTISQAMRALCAEASPANKAALTSEVGKLELMLRRGQ